MKTKHNIVGVMGILIAGCFIVSMPVFACAQGDFEALSRLAAAKDTEYFKLRDEVLRNMQGPWDLRLAASQAWDSGLVAFILNTRHAHRDAFKELDPQGPVLRASTSFYKLSGVPEANVAFLLEKAWKAPLENPDGHWKDKPGWERECAYKTLLLTHSWGERFARLGEAPLWKAIVEGSDDERLRIAAVHFLCADPDPLGDATITDLLREDKDIFTGYSLSCLKALKFRDTESTALAILSTMDTLKNDTSRLGPAVTALAANSSDQAREYVRKFVLDEQNNSLARSNALGMCCVRPHPGDLEMYKKFFDSSAPLGLKERLLFTWSNANCSIDDIRPVLRWILTDPKKAELIEGAGVALNNLYLASHGVGIDPSAKSEDASLLKNILATRDNLSRANRVHLQMYIQNLLAKPDDPPARLPD